MRPSAGDLSLSDVSTGQLYGAAESGNAASPKPNCSDGEPGDGIMFWFSDGEADRPLRRASSSSKEDHVPLVGSPRILSRQRDFVYDRISGEIDPKKYTLLANTLDAIVTVRWRGPGELQSSGRSIPPRRISRIARESGNFHRVAVALSPYNRWKVSGVVSYAVAIGALVGFATQGHRPNLVACFPVRIYQILSALIPDM